jgi:hypothetical protein
VVRLAGSVCWGWFSFHYFHALGCCWGCGWVEHNDRFMIVWGLSGLWGFGTLLGPEETPAVGWSLFRLAPGLGCLTHP